MEPAAVDARFEFLSPAWIDAASAFLKETVPQRPELAGLRFSLSESFAAPPPSLATDQAGWHFRLDPSGSIEAGPGPLPGADLSIRGPYQLALTFAQLVNGAGPEALARQQREVAHLFAPEHLTIDGRLPDHAGLGRLLNDLHDHLAAHTMENPCLEHRIDALHLNAQARQLGEQGYAVIERAITPEFADELCELTAAEVRAHHPLTTNGLLLRDRRYEELAQHPGVCALAQTAVGQNMILGAMSGTWKETGPGAIPLHADYPLVREPYPEFGLIAVAVWALQDWDTTDVGPTWVVPGSHTRRRPPKRGEVVEGAIPIIVPKGSVLVISHGIWHWQGDRTAPGARVAVHVTYNRVFVRQLDDFSALDPAAFARNPPAFSTLLGRDDPFGKSSFRGHDGKRFAYAGRFTQT